MKFGIIATTAYLLTDSTHAKLDAVAHLNRRQRRGLKKPLNTKKKMHSGSTSYARPDSKTRMLEDNVLSFSISNMAANPSTVSPKTKSGKSSKTGQKTKTLTAILRPLQQETDPSGTVTLRFNHDGSFLVSLDAAGLDPACAGDCKMAIKNGSSCDMDNAKGEDRELSSSDSDPWDDASTDYSTYDGTGVDADFSNSASRVSNGYEFADYVGYPFTLYAKDDTPYACGVLKGSDEAVTLEAEVGTYPGYSGELEVSGKIEVVYETDQTFKYKYSLLGLAENCNDCGIHIHAGKSCASPDLVLGHGWNSAMVQDLWTTAGGAVYNSNSDGNADGSFNTYNGYSIGQNMGHAVVVHTADGSRVGCGVLEGIIH